MLEMGLFWFGAAVIAVALLMLFFDAFKQNKGWGIAGLILLVPLLVHIFLAWSSLAVRKATYSLIIGVLAMLVSIAGGALAHLPFLQDHEVVQTLEENIAPPKEVPLPNEAEAQAITNQGDEDYDPLLSGSEYEEVDVEKMVPPSVTQVRQTAAARYLPIPVEDLAKVLNKQVRINMANGDVVDGTLTHIEEIAVTVESAVEGGSLGLSYNLSDVKSIAVRLAAGENLPEPQQEEDKEQSEESLEISPEHAVGEPEEQVQQNFQAPQIQEIEESITAPAESNDLAVPQELSESIGEAAETVGTSVGNNLESQESSESISEP